MRFRTLAIIALLAAAPAVTITGCSGKPENSPAIRKKFAEVDKMQQSVDQLTAEVALLNDQIRRLSEENSELRAFLPSVDGDSAVQKLSTLEQRLNKLETQTADRAVSQAVAQSRSGSSSGQASTTTTTATGSSAPRENLETAPLAGTTRSQPVAAASQEQTRTRTAPASSSPSSSFRDMTNPRSGDSAASSQPAQSSSASAPAPAATRGSYHVIQPGETVESIATKHNMTPADLLKANRLPNGARLANGQRLFIPAR